MKYSAQNYALSLHQAIKENKGNNLDKVFTNFAELLKEQGALAMYPQIEKHLEKLLLEDQGKALAEISTAREMKLDSKVIQLIEKIVGKELKIEHKIDESLVGGLVARVDDLLIDASLKRQLKELKTQLES